MSVLLSVDGHVRWKRWSAVKWPEWKYKYIHKCQSLGKEENMTTIGKIGGIDAADTVIQWWKVTVKVTV